MLNSCPSKTTESNLHSESVSFKLKYSKHVVLSLKSSNSTGISDTLVPVAYYQEEYFRYCGVSRS